MIFFVIGDHFKNEKPRMLRGDFFGRRVLWPNGEAAGPLAPGKLKVFPAALADGDVASGLGDFAPTPEDDCGGSRDERGAHCSANDELATHFHFRISPFPAGRIPATRMNGVARRTKFSQASRTRTGTTSLETIPKMLSTVKPRKTMVNAKRKRTSWRPNLNIFPPIFRAF